MRTVIYRPPDAREHVVAHRARDPMSATRISMFRAFSRSLDLASQHGRLVGLRDRPAVLDYQAAVGDVSGDTPHVLAPPQPVRLAYWHQSERICTNVLPRERLGGNDSGEAVRA
jgi:hypothetical protein